MANRELILVTLCRHHRACLFGEIVKGEMHLNKTGLVGQSVGEKLPQRYPYTDDVNMIMPQMGGLSAYP